MHPAPETCIDSAESELVAGRFGGACHAGGPSAATTAARSLTALPKQPRRALDWLLLLFCLAVPLPVLLIELGRPDVVDPQEARTLATSVDSWRHLPRTTGTHDPLELVTPYLNNRAELRSPPGLTWLHLAIFKLNPLHGPSDVGDLVLAAAGIGGPALLAVAAAFWAGKSIGGTPTAVFAGLVCAANPFFLYQVRLASPPVAHTALAMLSIAAALWAIRPLKPSPSLWRQGAGWAVSGLALAGAFLLAGPLAMITVVAPLCLLLLLCPGRKGHLLGLLAAGLIGVLTVLPWVLYVQQRDLRVWIYWLTETLPLRQLDLADLPRRAGERLLVGLAILLPWTLWLFGAILQPFSHSSRGARLRLFLSWSWFASVGLLLALCLVPSATRTCFPWRRRRRC